MFAPLAQSQHLPDEELVKMILAGEKRYFEWIIRRYNQRLFRVGMAILNNDTEVQEVIQSTYVKVYEHLPTFENRSSLATWITRIMVNECLSEKKKQDRARMTLDKINPNYTTMATPAKELVNRELGIILEDAISALPEKYRLVFVLREVEKLSVRETSLALAIEEPNVKTRLNRAKAMLRSELDAYMKDQVYPFHLDRCDEIVANVFARLGIHH